ncbi:uncharacterized protein LOC119336652 isoform X2 [Triticum dicoccoides]|uniref:uncharacterized protein LOC119336652 isoform X2 n=1 Tax=Triticum dicoccoides TaxID=85692 RepID=UPI001891361E|nr:uncharacterized protein LOC119336652 isoform X2 [Triticum dicoccoides]
MVAGACVAGSSLWLLIVSVIGAPSLQCMFASILFGSADRSLRMNFFLPLKRTTISQRSSTSTFPTSSVCACSTVCAHAQQHAEAGDVSCPARQPP